MEQSTDLASAQSDPPRRTSVTDRGTMIWVQDIGGATTGSLCLCCLLELPLDMRSQEAPCEVPVHIAAERWSY